jgi:hypothetical protein
VIKKRSKAKIWCLESDQNRKYADQKGIKDEGMGIGMPSKGKNSDQKAIKGKGAVIKKLSKPNFDVQKVIRNKGIYDEKAIKGKIK